MIRKIALALSAALLPALAAAYTCGTYSLQWSATTNPAGLAVDGATGNVYVVLNGSKQVKYYSSAGSYLGGWGGAGSTDGLFTDPIEADIRGSVIYVADTNNYRVQYFSLSGTFLGKWGSYGTGNGQFHTLDGLGIDPVSGNVYVSDQTHRVQYFSASGSYLGQWGSLGSGNGQFNYPFGVAVSPVNGYVYVADYLNNRVQYFSPSGSYLGQWGSLGSAAGQFSAPTYLSIDSYGYVFVTDQGNNRVQIFDASGAWQATVGSAGSGNGQFNVPNGTAIDPSGSLYIADFGGGSSNRIEKFSCSSAAATPTPASTATLTFTGTPSPSPTATPTISLAGCSVAADQSSGAIVTTNGTNTDASTPGQVFLTAPWEWLSSQPSVGVPEWVEFDFPSAVTANRLYFETTVGHPTAYKVQTYDTGSSSWVDTSPLPASSVTLSSVNAEWHYFDLWFTPATAQKWRFVMTAAVTDRVAENRAYIHYLKFYACGLAPSPMPTETPNAGTKGSKKDEARIYPNPGKRGAEKSHFGIELEEAGVARVTVWNSAAQIVGETEERFAAGKASLHLSTRNFAPGIYLCQYSVIYDSGRKVTGKVQRFAIQP